MAFAAAAVALAALAVLLTARLTAAALVASALVLAGLLASYALAVTTGLPLLHPAPEEVEPLALVTKAIESLGLLTAVALLRRERTSQLLLTLRTKGMTT